MDAAAMETTAEIVRQTAARWHRRYGAGGLDVRDLAQEGWTAVLAARRTWDPARRWEPYAQVAAGHAIGWYAIAARAPVSGRHRRARLLAVARVPEVALADAPDPAPTPEERVTEAHDRARIVALVRAAIARAPNGHLAAAVLLAGEPVAAVAAEYRVPRRAVSRALRAARASIAHDPELVALWAAAE